MPVGFIGRDVVAYNVIVVCFLCTSLMMGVFGLMAILARLGLGYSAKDGK